MRALVTGATGFVGAAVARALVNAGWQVRALVRTGSDQRNLHHLPLERVPGDLNDPASLALAVGGCDALFHVAADYRLGVADPRQLYRTNVEGTRNLLEAAGAPAWRASFTPAALRRSACRPMALPAPKTPRSRSPT
jgi:dihydroflavonol-4-reductase